MRLITSLVLFAATVDAQGPYRIQVYDAAGRATVAGDAWLIKDFGLLATRSLLRGAARAEIEIDGETRCVSAVAGEDEDLDLVRINLDPPLSNESSGLVMSYPPSPNPRTRNVPGLGDVSEVSAPEAARGRLMLNANGHWTAIVVPLANGGSTPIAVPAARVFSIRHREAQSLAAWNAATPRPAEIERTYRDGLERVVTGDLSGAMAVFQQLVEKDPAYGHAWFQLGYLHGKRGDAAKKIEAFRKAIQTEPSFGEAYYSLAFAYLLVGDRIKAREVYQDLKRVDARLAESLAILIESIHIDPVALPKSTRPIA